MAAGLFSAARLMLTICGAKYQWRGISPPRPISIMEKTMHTATLTQEQLDEALDGVEHLQRVEIEIVPGGYFAWRLFGDGREVVAGVAAREQFAAMLQVTEVLFNPELGIRGERLCLAGCN